MRERTAELLRSAFFEAVFVVLGVVLALAANEWREARTHREQGRAALASIVEELRANRDGVAASLEYHRSRLDTLRAHRPDDWTPSIQLFARGFIFPAQVGRTAWTSASETGTLSYMPYADVLRISRAYAEQARYEDQARAAGQIVFASLYEGGHAAVLRNHRNLAGLIETFRYRETQLVATYDSVLAGLPPSDDQPGDVRPD